MELERFSKANEIKSNIDSLNHKIETIEEILRRAYCEEFEPEPEPVGMTLDFVNVSDVQRPFDVTREEMYFILHYLIENWKNQREELAATFEQV